MGTRTAIYIRVSTEEQAREGFSIAAQQERLTAFIRSQSWEVADLYIDEGYSAKNLERPEMQRLLRDIRKQLVDIVVVYRLDRLTRSVLDLYRLLQEFDRYGVNFRSCTEVYDTTTAIGRLFITLVAALAQWERENLAERVKMGMEQMAQEKKRPGGPSPYGYEIQNGMLVPQPFEAEIVKLIFAKFLSGASLQQIARQLNQLGLRGKTGAAWSPTTLSHLLQNHVYYGALRWNYSESGQKLNAPEKWILHEDAYQPLIDKETFLSAQMLLTNRKRKHPRQLASPFLFSSLLYCALCQAPMIGKTGNSKKKSGKCYTYRYYLCPNRRKGVCQAPMIREDLLEAAIFRRLSPYLTQWPTDQACTLSSNHTASPTPLLHLHQQRLERKRLRLSQAFEEMLLTAEQYRHKLTELQTAEQELFQQIAEQEDQLSDGQLIQALKDVSAIWNQATSAEKKHLITLLVDKIEAAVEKPQTQGGNKQVRIATLAFR
ncbi:recombinase family protein [Brevibacillus fulvus]|uniref:Site-specific DNA recombinase n=1 Tax=Brevibacillus fulvus TaxID=1125967 RepID=A0A939BUT9_9BACL|nr:recombinase family protein [Brevibacillus fulvus]MBM7590779.1 site-specific DNA recombinase [Brevibacillus fulvus]